MSDTAMSDLRGSSAPKEVRFGSMGKIVSAIVVVCALGAVGGYVYSTTPQQPKQHVTNDELPTTAPPAQQ
jgi:hypothetical protein